MVESDKWVVLIVFLILANSAVLASEYYMQPDWLTQFQFYANIVFTFLFALEMILAMIGLGLKDYFADGFNIFDCIIVVLSLIDLTVSLS